MINIMHSVNKPMNQADKSLDAQLWNACAGGMVQIPPLNSTVYYFPQGHAEHAHKNIDFSGFSQIPPLILCKVSSIKYLADSETDEVYAKIRLIPLRENEYEADNESRALGFDRSEEKEKSNSFAKTLTQSDANNGGGFSVPRYCAETIFPRLDYSAEPPVQTILAKDVHGEVWKFRHIYRGTPRRHLLTTGWSNFVNRKKVVAGDSIVFLRSENGDLRIGIRRAKTTLVCGPEVSSGVQDFTASLYRGFSSFENGSFGSGNGKNGNGLMSRQRGKVRDESVTEAINLATKGQAFEVVYYPSSSTPEFVVRASMVRAAMRVHWCPSMRFKMAFETEDSSRISWFMGTISSVQVDDPIHWPNSPWRLLQVLWDEPDLLQNVKRVNPWLVELVPHMPSIPFSPPIKRLRFPEFPQLPLTGKLPIPQFTGSSLSPIYPLSFLPDNISAGMQGTRHSQFGLSSCPKLAKLQPFMFEKLYYDKMVESSVVDNHDAEVISCSQMTRNYSQSHRDNGKRKSPMFCLFGQPILTEQQISESRSTNTRDNLSSGSGSAVIQNCPLEASSDDEVLWLKDQKLDLSLDMRHC